MWVSALIPESWCWSWRGRGAGAHAGQQAERAALQARGQHAEGHSGVGCHVTEQAAVAGRMKHLGDNKTYLLGKVLFMTKKPGRILGRERGCSSSLAPIRRPFGDSRSLMVCPVECLSHSSLTCLDWLQACVVG